VGWGWRLVIRAELFPGRVLVVDKEKTWEGTLDEGMMKSRWESMVEMHIYPRN
jgi:hypothetical protein